MSVEKICTPIKGAIGEFYVASFLSALNLVVALPRGGVPSSDLLVTTANGSKTISLQIKTAFTPFNRSKKYGDYWAWDVSSKAKDNRSELLWYVFVSLNNWPHGDKSPDLFFVPAEKVSDVVAEWNDPDSSRLFFKIDDITRELFEGIEGFEKMKLALT
jgi:hypothetical protein